MHIQRVIRVRVRACALPFGLIKEYSHSFVQSEIFEADTERIEVQDSRDLNGQSAELGLKPFPQVYRPSGVSPMNRVLNVLTVFF